MKILCISNMYPGPGAPIRGIFVRQQLERMAEQGVEIDLLAIHGIRHGLFGKLCCYLAFWSRICLTRFSPYDWIHIHYPTHILPVLWFRSPRKQILQIHDGDLNISRHPWPESWTKWFVMRRLPKTGPVIVPSRFVARQVERCGVSPEKIMIYPSGGIDLGTFYPASDLPPADGRLRIICVGRLDDNKGVDVLLKAVALLHIPFELTIVGDGELRETLEKLSKELGIEQQVSFAGGRKHGELAELLRTFDVLVFPTLFYESLGLVGIEGMACGLPVIASRRGAPEEYVNDGGNGFLFTPGDAEELAGRLEHFAALSGEERSVLRRNAVATAAEYDADRVTKRLVADLKAYREQTPAERKGK